MSKDTVTFSKIREFLREIRRQRSKCYGLILHFSRLEKRFQQSGYRLSAVKALQPLISNYDARTFPLSNTDIVVVTVRAGVDHIQTCLENMLYVFEDSSVVSSLKNEPLVDDRLVSWFPLSDKFDQFDTLMQSGCTSLSLSSEPSFVQQEERPDQLEPGDANTAPRGSRSGDLNQNLGQVPKMKLLKAHDIDQLSKTASALVTADIGGFMERSIVKALIPGAPPTPVMSHCHVSYEKIVSKILGSKASAIDETVGYFLKDLISERLFASEPDMGAGGVLGASIGVTSRCVLSDHFEKFDRRMAESARKRIILEFSVRDLVSDPNQFVHANSKARLRGYKTQLGDLDSRSLLWLRPELLEVNFFKLKMNEAESARQSHDDTDHSAPVKSVVKALGAERVILSGCDDRNYIDWGQSLGIRMFMGSEV